MCAMWVGFSSFLRVGRKKQNKFPSNLHCPVKKLNPFFRYLLSLSYLSGRLSFYTCCQLFFCLPKLHIFCILCGYCGAGVEYIKNQLIINRQKDSLFSQYYEPSHECKSQWSGCFYALIIPEYTLNQFRLPEDVSRNCALNHEV